MAKRNQVEVMDGYRTREKYCGTPVNRIVLTGIEALCKPLEILDKAIERRFQKPGTKRVR